MKQLLQYIKYDTYKWNISVDLKVIALLLALQLGYTKFPCFLYEWDSRVKAHHYVKRIWPARTILEPEYGGWGMTAILFFSSVFSVQCWYVYMLCFAVRNFGDKRWTCHGTKQKPKTWTRRYKRRIGSHVRNGHFLFWSSVDRSTCALWLKQWWWMCMTWILFKLIVPETVYWTLVLRFLNNFTGQKKGTSWGGF